MTAQAALNKLLMGKQRLFPGRDWERFLNDLRQIRTEVQGGQ